MFLTYNILNLYPAAKDFDNYCMVTHSPIGFRRLGVLPETAKF